MSRNPSLAEVINAATETALEGIYVSLPARVVRYDSATQSVDAQPIPKVKHTDEDGAAVVQQLPVVPSAPVQFPGSGAFTITFPIEVGDVGLLVFSGVSMDKWLHASGDEPADPETHARHSLSDAVFIPGLKNLSRPRQSAPTDHVRIGVDGAAEQGAGLGDSIASYLTSIHTWAAEVQTALNTLGVPISPPLPAVPTVSSGTVKVTE